VFGNPDCIISDRGSAFLAQDFLKYCDDENIKVVKSTTGLPRVNGQVERLNAIIIPVLSKLSVDDPTKWYRHVDRVQQAINSTFSRSINATPFELLIGVKMRNKDDHQLHELINNETIELFQDSRNDLRLKAKSQILKLQSENKKTYNLRRKPARLYNVGDIKRTQFGGGLKLKPKFLGPYQSRKSSTTTPTMSRKSATQTVQKFLQPVPNISSHGPPTMTTTKHSRRMFDQNGRKWE